MQTGVINSENIADVFRQFSQKRKQGVLEITGGAEHLHILFAAGRIVDARPAEGSLIESLAKRLAKAGKISCEVSEFVTEVGVTKVGEEYKAVFLKLNESDEMFCDEEEFKQIVKHSVLDYLYCMDLGAGAYYNFKVQMIEFDRDLCPSLSVGQMLLDLVALESEGERFEALFADNVAVQKTGKEPNSLSEEEQRIFDLLEKPRPLQKLKNLSLLSRFHVMEALLSMHDSGLVEVTELQEVVPEEPDVVVAKNGKAAAEPVPEARSASASATSEELEGVDDIMAALDDSLSELEGDDDDSSDTGIDIESLRSAQEAFDIADDLDDEDVADGYEEDVETDDDSLEEEEEWEYEEQHFEPGARVRLNMLNMKLLHSEWIPRVLVVLYVSAAFLVPAFLWGSIFEHFSRF